MFLLRPLAPRVLGPRFASLTARFATCLAYSSDMPSTLPDSESKPLSRRLGRPDGWPQLLISTLNPALLQPEDYVDLSGLKTRNIGSIHALTGRNSCIHYWGKHAFPVDCAGFLYYRRGSGAAPLEGGIRFRRTRDHRPSSFPGGHDLLLPSGAPWELILPQLTRPTYRRLADQLLHENLATTDQLDLCHKIFTPMGHILAPLIIFHHTQTFPVNFGGPIRLTVVGSRALHSLISEPFGQTSLKFVKRFPFAGSAIPRFEPSAMDRRRLLHLRIAKIITPFMCTDDKCKARVVQPEEGQLFIGLSRGGDRPWELNLDGPSRAAAAFRVLWDSTDPTDPSALRSLAI
ncbi:hypothetical protein B0H16DRAFT_1823491 [Mycena metata]|uniref:Uncharacterized protein n=1 Tax=Mycena metata TaxID=1033252 RepID=A0AAD7GYP0_9AGAR|nr:hypothetical protein B0H16DRAFT_1823491 [Mycena metata]